jgi:hypothetical protein
MAKKIRKQTRPSLSGIFLLLLMPWIVMGVIAVFAFKAGASDVVAIGLGLIGSLIVTVMIRGKMPKRKPA